MFDLIFFECLINIYTYYMYPFYRFLEKLEAGKLPNYEEYLNQESNLMDYGWILKEMGTCRQDDFKSPWKGNAKDRDNLYLSNNSAYRTKKIICEHVQPQKLTHFLLLAVYQKLHIDFSIFNKRGLVHLRGIISPRLEAFCRIYVSSVLDEYLHNSRFKLELKNRLSHPSGVVFYRGNQFCCELTEEKKRKKEKEGIQSVLHIF